MSLSAARPPRYKLNLAAAVFDVFPKIFFLPEICEKFYAAGKVWGVSGGKSLVAYVIAFVKLCCHAISLLLVKTDG